MDSNVSNVSWSSRQKYIANKLCKICGILNRLKFYIINYIEKVMFLTFYVTSKLWYTGFRVAKLTNE